MKLINAALLISSLLVTAFLENCHASTVVLPRDPTVEEETAMALTALLHRRALPNSPTGSYAPGPVPCPANRPTIRDANSLSPNETAWLQLRRNQTVEPMIDWLTRANISGFDAATYIHQVAGNASTLPNIGLAVSGGGYRAMLNAAGFMAAVDARTSNSTGPGHIGGLLQSATYVAGLSGGGWLMGSIFTNNFSSVEALRDGSAGTSLWQFGNSILEGPASDGVQLFQTIDYYTKLLDEVNEKQNAGFEASITDYWGRALSFQLVNATDGGPSYTFSSISIMENFANGSIPMPFLVTDGRAPNTKIISDNSTIYEMGPYEIGSWDPTQYAFAPMRYVGSNFTGGVIPSSEPCIEGFDNVGYVMGTSSTLFNQFLLRLNSTDIPDALKDIFRHILTALDDNDDDIAQWTPNPFYGFNNGTSRTAGSPQLTLTDGGEDNENIALYPLVQPVRALDVIFASDSTADNQNWPNGSSLVYTYRRSLNHTIANGTAFPTVPGWDTFINLGLNNRPTFFGCNASNLTGPAPLIVYIPNAPYIIQSNTSTFDLAYNNTFRDVIIENGYDVATLGNGTLDRQWPTCMACAALSRSFTKTGFTVPSDCVSCFERYCWNGTLDASPATYDPPYKLAEVNISSGASRELGVSLVSLAVSLLVSIVTLAL